jgi:predicted esterase
LPVSVAFAALALWPCAPGMRAQELRPGTVIDPVACAADPAETYALYLPSGYTSERPWSLLIAFHPAAQGRVMVEKFRAAAEQYGYIVAASNNARNGPIAVSAAAAEAVITDVARRFAVDPRQVYLAGMSGGARVAMAIALGGSGIAGVLASSAGYPDSQPRSSVPFAVYATAGTEDFNYVEMRLLDRALTSPHRLAVFHGGHRLPPDDVAFDALEWMTLEAMRSGRRPRNDAVVQQMLAKRRRVLAAATGPTETVHLLRALVADFGNLADVSAEATRLDRASRESAVTKALAREREEVDAEARLLQQTFELEASLADGDRRDASLMLLGARLREWSRTAATGADTPERERARRLLQSVVFGASDRVKDHDYLAELERYRRQIRAW